MQEVADDESMDQSDLAKHVNNGTAWVAVDAQNQPVAYLMATQLTDSLHIDQVSVDPTHRGERIGIALIEYAAAQKFEVPFHALTLTTFRNVPWNAPHYAAYGFVELAADDVPPELLEIRLREAQRGLDRWSRVSMVRWIDQRQAN